MGYVHKPIPPEVWRSMPLEVREQIRLWESVFLAEIRGHGRDGNAALGFVIILLFAIATLLLIRAI